MSDEEIRKLLGGYATDTLSEEERRALLEAALADQDLFNELAREQPLRDLLRDPAARQELLQALEEKKQPLGHGIFQWLRWPSAVALAGSLAVALIAVTLFVRRGGPPAAPLEQLAAVRREPAPALVLQSPPLAAPVERQPAPAKSKSRAAPAAKVARLEQAKTGPPASVAPMAGVGGAVAGQPTFVEPTMRLARRTATEEDRKTAAISSAAPAGYARDAMAPAAGKLGLRYSVLRKGEGDQYWPVDPGTVFRSGDSVRLNLESNDAGYLYVMMRDQAGVRRLLFGQQVEANRSYLIPAEGGVRYDEPGSKEFQVVLSRHAEPALANAQAPESSGAFSSNLVVEKREKLTYLVDTGTQPAAQRVEFEITLKFE